MLLVTPSCLFFTSNSLNGGECICDDFDFLLCLEKMAWILCQDVADSFGDDLSTEGQSSALKSGYFCNWTYFLYIQSQTEVHEGYLLLIS